MKRILTTLCALAIVTAGIVPALAAETDAGAGQDSSYYPISVEEYTYGETGEPRINKVYQLSLSDDPSGIPTKDFVRNGRQYHLLDMTQKNEVAADGYATRTQALSASRSYPNLSEADVSLIPKSIEEDGKTLTLADVQWSSTEQSDGAGGTVTRYTAAASYTGTSSYQYATGYTVTADYSGQVAKPNCNMATYTAIFGSTETGALDTEQDGGTENETGAVDLSGLKIPLLVGGAAVLLAAGGLLAFKKIKERR